jgi:hypothetical protein
MLSASGGLRTIVAPAKSEAKAKASHPESRQEMRAERPQVFPTYGVGKA